MRELEYVIVYTNTNIHPLTSISSHGYRRDSGRLHFPVFSILVTCRKAPVRLRFWTLRLKYIALRAALALAENGDNECTFTDPCCYAENIKHLGDCGCGFWLV
jgi:hypothetical protein